MVAGPGGYGHARHKTAGRDVHKVYASPRQFGRQPHRLVDGPGRPGVARLLQPVRGRHAHQQRQFVRPHLPHRLDHFQYEANPVFEGAPVLVGAIVAGRRQELVEKVAVGGMNFHGLEPGPQRPPGRVAKRRDDPLDARLVQRLGRRVISEGSRARRHRLPAAFLRPQRAAAVPRTAHRRLAPRVRQLNRRHGPLLLDEARDPGQSLDVRVVPDAQVVRRNASFRQHRGGLQDDQSYAARGAAAVVNDVPVIREAVHRRVLAHRRHADAVAQRYAPQLQRRKQERPRTTLSSRRHGRPAQLRRSSLAHATSHLPRL